MILSIVDLLLLSCEIGRVIWIFSCSIVWRVYRFLDTVLMDSDRYRCIFRSTTIIFEITGISAPYSFSTISYRFHFREKDVKTKVIWPPIDRFRSFSSCPVHLAYNPSYSACFFSRNNIFPSKKSANSIFQPAYNFSRTAPLALEWSYGRSLCGSDRTV
jgi:hypothetical protein